MLTSGIMYAYTINEIGSIMREMRNNKRLFNNDIEAVQAIAKEENINNNLLLRIKNVKKTHIVIKFI